MAEISEMIQARKEYVSLIKNELLGPGSEISIPDAEHELITNTPEVRYSIGILFPRDNKMNADNDDNARVEETAENEDTEESINDEAVEVKKNSEKREAVSPAEEENLDEEISLAAQNMPSSMGITFFAYGDSSVINCNISFGTYINARAQDCKIPFYPTNPDEFSIPSQLDRIIFYDKEQHCLCLNSGGITKKQVKELEERGVIEFDEYGLFNIMYKLCDQLKSGFVRVPHEAAVSLDFGEADYIDNNRNIDETCAKVTALRRQVSDNLFSITVMLVNDDTGRASGRNCIFQPEIRIESQNNNFVFKEYSGWSDFSIMDAEEQSLALQYRNKKVYGTGLGTSINWDVDSNGNGVVFSDFFPVTEVPQMEFKLPETAQVDSDTLSMKYLSDLNSIPKEEKIRNLNSLISAYGNWIDSLEERIESLSEEFKHIASENINGCRSAYNRMLNGLESLTYDDLKWQAFELSNRAMFMQRVHLSLQEATSDVDRFPYDETLSDLLDSIDYSSDEGLTENKHFWRPFQLAFLLMSVNGVSDDDCPDRDLVDLIWFPTGGGKTEAYLGLTAFTIFYRRLNNIDISGGTTVIMRYTLRLLAAQQFTRASTLICACEYIRCDCLRRRPKYKKYPLGHESITIGLWIGGEHTPNKNDQAKDHLNYLVQATADNLRENKDKHNKFQVLKCPWCGTKMVKERVDGKIVGTFGYRMRNNSRFELFCPQESCFFNQAGKLPIQIVDEELYENPPTLLFGTVDKFAMLPWKNEIGNFFGLKSNNRTPELIIQDELHLISGPLGTMVGLYETAIDALCRSKQTKSKIVASTATIRRAAEQCSALYDRGVAQFPPPGLDSEDSFFARESNINYDQNKYGRLYIGLMPSGKTKAMMEIRTTASLLQQINTMKLPDKIKDKYWTLTVYFNSLKDLGKCSTLVDDDIKDFIKRSAYRTGTAKDARLIVGADELTSRVSTTELNETLDKLEKLEYSKENIANKRYASNILLATNMISVGIDVARLNVMLLVGQPKLTSEYIQASSRIGRSYPGVAFAMYDGSKSRDRSHYEQFKPYHESFYKYVEPTGATPFSKPACERALHAVVISLLRHLVPELSPEKGAALFAQEKYTDQICDVKNFIAQRSKSVVKRINSSMDDESESISLEIDRIISEWQRMATNYGEDHFEYGGKYQFVHPSENEGRLMKAYNTDQYDEALNTMTSMRNVDSAVAGNVLIWED